MEILRNFILLNYLYEITNKYFIIIVIEPYKMIPMLICFIKKIYLLYQMKPMVELKE